MFEKILIAAALLLFPLFCTADGDGPFPFPQGFYKVKIEKSHLIPMRDKALLSTDLYFPDGVSGPVPVILIRTPYNKNDPRLLPLASNFASHGYVVAVQDVRGKWESEGIYTFLNNDRKDGYDTVDWLVSQPWSTNKVGTYGCSYLGEVQITLAAAQHPAVVAMIPEAASSNGSVAGRYRHFSGIYGGAYELAQGLGWFAQYGPKYSPKMPRGLSREQRLQALPNLRLAPTMPKIDFPELYNSLPLIGMLERVGVSTSDWDRFVSTPLDDQFFRGRNLEQDDKVGVAALHVNTWYDFGVAESFIQAKHFRENATNKRARDNQFLIVGGGNHCSHARSGAQTYSGKRSLGDTRYRFYDLYLRWFDHWLKGIDNGVTDDARFRYYLQGAEEWRALDRIPEHGDKRTVFYLDSIEGANSRWGDGSLSRQSPKGRVSDQFTYDPATPVPSLGGPLCCTGNDKMPPGSYDQRKIESRADVLVYSTPPLENGLEVVGPVKAVLYVSSSAPDTDFTGKLLDVYPDGRAFTLQEGIFRVRYRKGFDRQVRMKPGEVYEIEIDLQAIGNKFLRGHQVRLEVSSSNFPRFDRNMNTGGNNYDETEWRVAKNRVHHSSKYPSRLLLPVVTSGGSKRIDRGRTYGK